MIAPPRRSRRCRVSLAGTLLESVSLEHCSSQSRAEDIVNMKMWCKVPAAGLLLLGALQLVEAAGPPRVVCYYDSRSFWREGSAKMLPSDLEPALTYCTHVVYGYARIDLDSHKLLPLDEALDVDSGKGNFKAITGMKQRHPGIHVLLSVGGHADTADQQKYLTLLESDDSRAAFIGSAKTLLKQYGFDGLDLAWQFPEVYVKKDRGTFGSVWHKIKKTFGYAEGSKDEKLEEHRAGFTALVNEMKNSFRSEGWTITYTVLPNVNAEAYCDVKELTAVLDAVHLMAFDYKTPERSPEEADYSSPLFRAGGRNDNGTADGNVRWWLEHGLTSSKLVLGIPSYGRVWKLTADSKISGVPPLVAEGAAEIGPQTKTPGLLAYSEICTMTTDKASTSPHLLRRVTDPSQKLGTYAFRITDSDIPAWVSYEDPDTVGYKTAYTKNKGLGGVAICDISLDDFRGTCSGEKFPLLKTVRSKL